MDTLLCCGCGCCGGLDAIASCWPQSNAIINLMPIADWNPFCARLGLDNLVIQLEYCYATKLNGQTQQTDRQSASAAGWLIVFCQGIVANCLWTNRAFELQCATALVCAHHLECSSRTWLGMGSGKRDGRVTENLYNFSFLFICGQKIYY